MYTYIYIYIYIYFFFLSFFKYKVVELVGRGSVINGAYPHPVTQGTSTSMSSFTRYFKWLFCLLPRFFRICWPITYYMRVSWWTSNQKALKTPNSNFYFIYCFNITFYQQVHFIQTDGNANYLLHCTLGNFLAFMGAELWQLQCRVTFGGFCNFLLALSAHILVSASNQPKITLYNNCLRSAPMKATKVLNVP